MLKPYGAQPSEAARDTVPMPPSELAAPSSQPRLAGPDTLATRTRMEERSLCEDALRGDVAAWNALVQKHNHRVVVSLLARGIRIDRAKDIAQDAWIRLIEQQRE